MYHMRLEDYPLTQRLFICFFKIYVTARTYVRGKFDTLLYFLRRQQLSQIRRMTVLCSAFFTPSLWQYGAHSGRVGGRRFGRVLRVHPQESFKLFDTFFQLFDVLFQFRVLLFQLLYICVLVHIIVIGQRQKFTEVYFNYSKVGERLPTKINGSLPVLVSP